MRTQTLLTDAIDGGLFVLFIALVILIVWVGL